MEMEPDQEETVPLKETTSSLEDNYSERYSSARLSPERVKSLHYSVAQSLAPAKTLFANGKHDQAIGSAFNMLDLDKSGELSRDEICVLLREAAADMKLKVDDNVIGAAVDALIKEFGSDGCITLVQFHQMFQRHPELLKVFETEESMSLKKSLAQSARSDLTDAEKEEVQTEDNEVWKVPNYKTEWKNRRLAIIWFILYLGANITCITVKSIKYSNHDEAQAVFGDCIAVARGCAQALNFNALVILLPICRHFLTYLRNTRLRFLFPFDTSLEVHMLVGIVFALLSLSHVAAHICDFTKFASAPEEDLYALFGDKLGVIPESPGARWALLLKQRAGITGIIMVVCLLIAYPMILLRRKRFNTFWYTHHLLLVMLIALCIHGTGNLLESFQSIYWLTAPFVLYFVPRFLRETRCSTLKVIEARLKPGECLQLKLERPNRWDYRVRAGMYAFLNIPEVSRLEWHPFTLTSSPANDFVEFHFRSVGDWTKKAHKVFEPFQSESDGYSDEITFPRVKVEGPIGASSQGFSDYPIIILIGAGIGITPMVSVLRELLENPRKMRRTFFYWTTRDQNSFGWFSSLMDDIYDADSKNVLQIRHFLTSAKHDDRDLGEVLLKYAVRAEHKHTDMDLILGRQTHHQVETGRPDWDDEFSAIREESKELGFNKCGVFLCGPEKMAEAVDESSLKLSKEDPDFHFYFSKETF